MNDQTCDRAHPVDRGSMPMQSRGVLCTSRASCSKRRQGCGELACKAVHAAWNVYAEGNGRMTLMLQVVLAEHGSDQITVLQCSGTLTLH